MLLTLMVVHPPGFQSHLVDCNYRLVAEYGNDAELVPSQYPILNRREALFFTKKRILANNNELLRNSDYALTQTV